MVIEIDGDVHAQGNRKKMDCQREAYLTTLGLKVIRYPNDDVLNNLDGVLQDLENKIFLGVYLPLPLLTKEGQKEPTQKHVVEFLRDPRGWRNGAGTSAPGAG